MIERTMKTEIQLTPSELAKEFWSMNATQQVGFFTELHKISEGRLPFQLQNVIEDDSFNSYAKSIMSTIGQYGE